MVVARAPETRTTATAPRPGADASATRGSSPPGSAAAVSAAGGAARGAAGRMARYVRAGPCTAGPAPFFRSCAISHCCGSDARFCTK